MWTRQSAWSRCTYVQRINTWGIQERTQFVLCKLEKVYAEYWVFQVVRGHSWRAYSCGGKQWGGKLVIPPKWLRTKCVVCLPGAIPAYTCKCLLFCFKSLKSFWCFCKVQTWSCHSLRKTIKWHGTGSSQMRKVFLWAYDYQMHSLTSFFWQNASRIKWWYVGFL